MCVLFFKFRFCWPGLQWDSSHFYSQVECVKCVYLVRGGVGGQWVGWGYGMSITNPVGTRARERVSVFGLRRCRWCRESGWGTLDKGLGLGGCSGVTCVCVCVLWVWIFCVDGRSRYLYCSGQITAHLRCTHWSTLLHLIDIFFLPYLSVANIANQDLFVYSCRTWISLDCARGSAWPSFPKKSLMGPQLLEGGRCGHNFHSSFPDHSDSSTACMLCRFIII